MDEDLVVPLPEPASKAENDAKILADFQSLWLRTTFWLRSYFQSLLDNSKDLPVAAAGLFTLPNSFYHAFEPYFGSDIAQQVYNIIYEMIRIGDQLIGASKISDYAQVSEIARQWYDSTARAASYYASINPYWDELELYTLLSQYGMWKIQGILAYLQGNFEEELSINYQLEMLSLAIGSYMARGIIARNAALQGQNGVSSQ